MFQEGEHVVYGPNGVCRIEGTRTLDIQGIPKDRKYYVLLPISQGGTIYVPVDSAEDKMRKVISKPDAEDLIDKLQRIDPLKAADDKTAEELYKNCIRSYDCTEWVRLIKCIYQHREIRKRDGKKVTARDEKYMRMAEDALYSELGFALEIPKEQVLDYILSKKDIRIDTI